MKELMDTWRRLLREVKEEEDEKKRLLGVDVLATDDEFQVGDEVAIKVVDDEEGEEEEIDEWKKEDDAKYPSRKKRRMNSKMQKPDRGSWVHGHDELAALGRGKVGMDNVALQEKKKERKKQCHAYNPFHGKDGTFVNPEKESGSSSMASPDGNSPDDCTWGQNRRSSANRSTQSTKRPCGRAGKYRCKDGSEKYEEALQNLEEYLVQPSQNEGINQSQLEAYLSGVISRELERAIKKHMQGSGCSFQQMIRAVSLWADAEKGTKK